MDIISFHNRIFTNQLDVRTIPCDPVITNNNYLTVHKSLSF